MNCPPFLRGLLASSRQPGAFPEAIVGVTAYLQRPQEPPFLLFAWMETELVGDIESLIELDILTSLGKVNESASLSAPLAQGDFSLATVKTDRASLRERAQDLGH